MDLPGSVRCTRRGGFSRLLHDLARQYRSKAANCRASRERVFHPSLEFFVRPFYDFPLKLYPLTVRIYPRTQAAASRATDPRDTASAKCRGTCDSLHLPRPSLRARFPPSPRGFRVFRSSGSARRSERCAAVIVDPCRRGRIAAISIDPRSPSSRSIPATFPYPG